MHMPGGTALYFSLALSKLDIKYLLVTKLALSEMNYVHSLHEQGINVNIDNSAHTVYFENIYGNTPDERMQNVLKTADPFSITQIQDIKARVFHLGPLLAKDISLELIKILATKGRVSLDVQGYLRKVVNQKVYAADWPDKHEALNHVSIVKADHAELQALTGLANPYDGARLLASWGVQEAVITDGSRGSFIYSDGLFYTIPAYPPRKLVDATGCGDTYMAGYLYCRAKGLGIHESGKFAAAMASLKMESSGPFTGTEREVLVSH